MKMCVKSFQFSHSNNFILKNTRKKTVLGGYKANKIKTTTTTNTTWKVPTKRVLLYVSDIQAFLY